jgi:uncharacterized membrane protein
MHSQPSEQQALNVVATTGGTSTATNVVLIAATVLTGLSTGVMALYAHTIMPGLKKTDDRTFVGAYQAIDRAIVNPWFMVTFFGALILLGVAGVQHFDPARRSVLPWLVAAFVLYLITVSITMMIHIPLNDAIDKAGDPKHIDVAKVRADFHEARWVAWNYVRTITSTAAFVILVSVLTLTRRT